MQIKRLVFAGVMVAGVAACGGGADDGGGSSSSSAQGLWHGTTNTGRTMSGLVLDNGNYWLVYSAVANANVVGGVVQGGSAAAGGTFTSSNGKDFNLEGAGISDFTLAGTYTPKGTLGGTVTYAPSVTTTFTTTYDADYELTPLVTTIMGTYAGTAITSQGAELATVTISFDGSIAGTGASGCTFTGMAVPRAQGNVFNVTVTFGGGVCAGGTSTVTGVAYFDADSKKLVSTALNAARTDGFLYLGVKP